MHNLYNIVNFNYLYFNNHASNACLDLTILKFLYNIIICIPKQ